MLNVLARYTLSNTKINIIQFLSLNPEVTTAKKMTSHFQFIIIFLYVSMYGLSLSFIHYNYLCQASARQTH
jgi:hypothetical protein